MSDTQGEIVLLVYWVGGSCFRLLEVNPHTWSALYLSLTHWRTCKSFPADLNTWHSEERAGRSFPCEQPAGQSVRLYDLSMFLKQQKKIINL